MFYKGLFQHKCNGTKHKDSEIYGLLSHLPALPLQSPHALLLPLQSKIPTKHNDRHHSNQLMTRINNCKTNAKPISNFTHKTNDTQHPLKFR